MTFDHVYCSSPIYINNTKTCLLYMEAQLYFLFKCHMAPTRVKNKSVIHNLRELTHAISYSSLGSCVMKAVNIEL